MAERRFTGRCASPGLAQGVLQAVEMAAVAVRRLGAPAAEAEALKMALRSAGKALLDLMAQGDADAAAIVEFQLAFVEDETLSAPAFAAITSGALYILFVLLASPPVCRFISRAVALVISCSWGTSSRG